LVTVALERRVERGWEAEEWGLLGFLALVGVFTVIVEGTYVKNCRELGMGTSGTVS
jgi:hypothetical protein